MEHKKRPLLLVILDGWGYREQTSYNAIHAAHTPHWDALWQHAPHTLIAASGKAVGLPPGQMGNSEVGHLTIGAGRVIYQDFTRITHDIETGGFFKNPVLLQAVKTAARNKKAIHLLGLLSPGGVHSHEQHFEAMIDLALQEGAHAIYVHAFLDGRDTPPRSAQAFLLRIDQKLKTARRGRIVSLIGRFYAMDRDKRWERIQCAYDLITQGIAVCHASSAEEGLQLAYARGETDEFVQATALHDPSQPPTVMQSGDVAIFMNFRTDRTRELTHAFIDNPFPYFERVNLPALAEFVTFTEYEAGLKTNVAYPPLLLKNILAEILEQHGLRQLHIAETEKYAHVTFFFNGGIETPFPHEKRILVPSPQVKTYDQQPEMSAIQITDHIVAALTSTASPYDFIVCNFANPDMVGHTGHFNATVKAIETIDTCLGRIIETLKKVGGEAIITADHGNAECLYDEATQQPHTAHTSDPVPFIYVGRPAKITSQAGTLSDIAPTLLYLMGIPQPPEMTGQTLLAFS